MMRPKTVSNTIADLCVECMTLTEKRLIPNEAFELWTRYNGNNYCDILHI